jgi:SulP family sulfate permease
VPLATLAAVLVFVATRVFHGKQLAAIFKFDRFEFGLALITLLTVAVIGVEQGIAVAVVLAILDRTRITSHSKISVLGRIANSTSWTPLQDDPDATPLPGVLVVLFSRPLWYANSVHFQADLRAVLAQTAPPPRALVLDVIGMTDIDFTGSRTLADEVDDLKAAHIELGIARASTDLMASMKRKGIVDMIGANRFYDSVDEAVRGLSANPAATPPVIPPPPEPDPH